MIKIPEFGTVEEIISGIMDNNFYDETNCFYTRYNEDDDEAAQVIEDFLKNDERVVEFNVDSDTLFDSSGFACGYISVAWYERVGYLGHVVFQWGIL